MKDNITNTKLCEFNSYLLNRDLSESTLSLYISNVNQFINYFEETEGIEFNFSKVTIKLEI
ncbi:MAG: hypothetical protein RR891_01580 [Clostridium sp.]|uniref:hypothetical protein n=1 Tax=Clostridium sp. TaxID=1506 RepID=UPI00302DF918